MKNRSKILVVFVGFAFCTLGNRGVADPAEMCVVDNEFDMADFSSTLDQSLDIPQADDLPAAGVKIANPNCWAAYMVGQAICALGIPQAALNAYLQSQLPWYCSQKCSCQSGFKKVACNKLCMAAGPGLITSTLKSLAPVTGLLCDAVNIGFNAVCELVSNPIAPFFPNSPTPTPTPTPNPPAPGLVD